MLPHQAPLYSAFDAFAANDLKLAEAEIDQFFAALESDSIALEYRRQIFDRQVFEADFISMFTKEEIDAWCVLSSVKMQRRDWSGARDDSYRQIELIDQHYGFATPSWERPEFRIPRDQELADRYFRLASQLATICSSLNENDMSERWSKVSGAAVADPVDPDQVWGEWPAEEGDDLEPFGLNPYEFSNWSLNKIDVEGTRWLVNLFSDLPGRASPLKFSTLVTVRIPTDTTGDVPTKSVRWRIWSLRQALASRLKRHNVGIFFGELQRRGERVLLYYATNEREVRLAIEAVLEAAAELSPCLEMGPDDHWKEYSKWGGQSVMIAPSTVQAPDAGLQEHENDSFLREVWKQCESLTSVWTKLYSLLWVVNLVPPQSATVHEFCIDYFFELINFLSAQETSAALWHMVWKLPSFDPVAAVRAFDLIQLSTISAEDHCTANFAAESLADFDPERALRIIEALKKEGYTLIHKPAGKIAVSFARTDIERGRVLIASTREYILGLGEQAFSKVTYFTELADLVCGSYPEVSRQLLIEANDNIAYIEGRSTCAQVYMAVLAAAKRAAPDLLPMICPGALKAASALMAPSDDWMDFGGPLMSINYMCWIVPYVVLYNKRMALEVLTQATDTVVELEDEELLELLPSLAEAAGDLGMELNRELADRLWTMLELRSQKTKSPGRSFLSNRRIAGNPSPAEAFVNMNPPLAAKRIATIFAICDLSVLPEQQVELLSTFAASMHGHMDCAKKLFFQAADRYRNCSSAFLRANALSQVAAAMHSVGLDTSEACEETINIIDGIGAPQSRLAVLLEASRQCTEKYPEFANQLLEKSIPLLEEITDLPPTLIEQLYGLPGSHSSKLFFAVIKSRKDDSRLSEHLSRFAASFAEDKARTS